MQKESRIKLKKERVLWLGESTSGNPAPQLPTYDSTCLTRHPGTGNCDPNGPLPHPEKPVHK